MKGVKRRLFQEMQSDVVRQKQHHSKLHNLLLFPWDVSTSPSPTLLLDPEFDAFPKASGPACISSCFDFCVFMQLSRVLHLREFTFPSIPIFDEESDSGPYISKRPISGFFFKNNLLVILASLITVGCTNCRGICYHVYRGSSSRVVAKTRSSHV